MAVRSVMKRLIDLTGALVALVLLLPLLVLIALVVRLDSNGSALFRQRRTGRGGRSFWLVKFRTMVPDAESRLDSLEHLNEAEGGVLFKIRSDPRVTRLGSFLRRTSLDELPQLWNVVRGDMSLVGPRPLQLRDSERLRRIDPDAYARRHSILPGLTGPWQVGGRSDADTQRMVLLDLEYVATWSLRRDLAILGQTIGVVLRRQGAY